MREAGHWQADGDDIMSDLLEVIGDVLKVVVAVLLALAIVYWWLV